jgi:hypothetical protein
MSDINSKLLPGMRLAIGTGAWAMPGMTGKVFGFDLAEDHEATYLGRLFGIRDVALGVGVLANSGEQRRMWLQLGILCDLADAAAGLLAMRSGVNKRAGALATLTALAAAGMGVAALGAEKD